MWSQMQSVKGSAAARCFPPAGATAVGAEAPGAYLPEYWFPAQDGGRRRKSVPLVLTNITRIARATWSWEAAGFAALGVAAVAGIVLAFVVACLPLK